MGREKIKRQLKMPAKSQGDSGGRHLKGLQDLVNQRLWKLAGIGLKFGINSLEFGQTGAESQMQEETEPKRRPERNGMMLMDKRLRISAGRLTMS